MAKRRSSGFRLSDPVSRFTRLVLPAFVYLKKALPNVKHLTLQAFIKSFIFFPLSHYIANLKASVPKLFKGNPGLRLVRCENAPFTIRKKFGHRTYPLSSTLCKKCLKKIERRQEIGSSYGINQLTRQQRHCYNYCDLPTIQSSAAHSPP